MKRPLSIILTALMLLSAGMSGMAWSHTPETAPTESHTAMADMAMPDHCDHDESASDIQDCVNHCANVVAVLIEPIATQNLSAPVFDRDRSQSSPFSRHVPHWRPPTFFS